MYSIVGQDSTSIIKDEDERNMAVIVPDINTNAKKDEIIFDLINI